MLFRVLNTDFSTLKSVFSVPDEPRRLYKKKSMNVPDMTCELLNETFKCHHVYYVLGTMLKTE